MFDGCGLTFNRLSVYKGFTGAAVLYQSLKSKAHLKSIINSPSQIIETARRQEIGSLRALEYLFRNRVRGFTGAARYLAGIIHTWVVTFEDLLSRDGPACSHPSVDLGIDRLGPHHPIVSIGDTGHEQSPMAMAFNQRPRFSDQWSPSHAQQLFPMFQTDPMTEYTSSFAELYTMAEQMDLSLTTTTNDYQGTYNWQPPQNWIPEPPSAAVDGTDFSGADMFNLDSEYRNFEVGDLLLPPWMAAQGMPYP